MRQFTSKLVQDELKLVQWRDQLRGTVVVTNGCFDWLHFGHVSYLEEARLLGDYLVVGINNDESVRTLKGKTRPLMPDVDRARIVASLEAVDGVFIFQGVTATNFLRLTRPSIWVKGGDYTLDSLNQDERCVVEQYGGTIKFLPFIANKSTTIFERKFYESGTVE